ncbi:uncharacterized protein EI90DRAFT_3012998 [Cantharellus anzutake]|uniref:uncharacterized protein n=1 Tax=Cantharellus anzutake TaxID=1750568 RepID=UPI001903E40A|nr:uncharacterized protein EI90DRAFT_3012998 [Cantharellus anzutake]KAF8338862.1 hypothetical protein EI90DRAFT_3012998 [Cantharellus anzutake]
MDWECEALITTHLHFFTLDVGEADATPIDPDPIRSPNAPPDELDSSGVVADTEAPTVIAANLDPVPIDTETQSAVRGTGSSAPVPLLPTMSGEPTGTNNPPVDKATMKGDLPLSVVAPREDVSWREFIQTFVPEGPPEPASTVPRRTLDPTRASKQTLRDQGTLPMVTMTWNLHDDNGLPEFVHVPESEESASSPAWIPSHLKEKWVNKDCNEPDHFLKPRNQPPDDEANRSEGLQKTITEMLGQVVMTVVEQLNMS